MPYDEQLAVRIRDRFKDRRGITEQRMFGGLCFMFRGNMICGVEKSNLVVRVGTDHYEKFLKEPHARKMDFTGRPLKGFIYVSADGCKTTAGLKKWTDRAFDFVRTLPAK